MGRLNIFSSISKAFVTLGFVASSVCIALYSHTNPYHDGMLAHALIFLLFDVFPLYAVINYFRSKKKVYVLLTFIYLLCLLPYGYIGYNRLELDGMFLPEGSGHMALILVPVFLFAITCCIFWMNRFYDNFLNPMLLLWLKRNP